MKIETDEAVKRLVEWFAGNFEIEIHSPLEYHLEVILSKTSKSIYPDWITAIINGNNSPAAVRVGLEDLFCSILEGDET